MSVLDPKRKNELSKNFAPAYTNSNLLKSEAVVDEVIAKLCEWMDKHVESQEPMGLVRKVSAPNICSFN